MITQNYANTLVMQRQNHERRQNDTRELPFITEEGLVLFDRREKQDRRRSDSGAWQQAMPSTSSSKHIEQSLVARR